MIILLVLYALVRVGFALGAEDPADHFEWTPAKEEKMKDHWDKMRAVKKELVAKIHSGGKVTPYENQVLHYHKRMGREMLQTKNVIHHVEAVLRQLESKGAVRKRQRWLPRRDAQKLPSIRWTEVLPFCSFAYLLTCTPTCIHCAHFF
jgi:hypothetical protein